MCAFTAANRFYLLREVSKHGAWAISLFAMSSAPMEFPRETVIHNLAQAKQPIVG
jgi:hypothetical protein